MEKNNDKRIFEYDFLRSLAMILVVIAHCTYFSLMSRYGGIDYSQGKIIKNPIITFIGSLVQTIPIPIFFIVSGGLFRNTFISMKKRNEGIKELTIKKFKRLMIPFFVVNLVWSIPIRYICNYYSNSTNVLYDIFVGQILIQGTTHLWFLPVLFITILITYFLEKKEIKGSIILPITFVLHLINGKLPIVIMAEFCRCFIYFYLGYYFTIYRDRINEFIQKYKKSSIIVGGLVLVLMAIYVNIQKTNFILKLIRKIVILLVQILSFLFFYIIAMKIKKRKTIVNVIEKINEYTFGIYLYADPLNYLIMFLFHKYGTMNYYGTALGVSIMFFVKLIITSIVPFIITYILKKLKVKYIC